MFEVLLVYIKVSLSKRLVKVAYREGGISPRVLSFPLYAETRTIFTDPVMRKEGVLFSGLVSGEYIMIAYRLQLIIVCRNINDAESESKGNSNRKEKYHYSSGVSLGGEVFSLELMHELTFRRMTKIDFPQIFTLLFLGVALLPRSHRFSSRCSSHRPFSLSSLYPGSHGPFTPHPSPFSSSFPAPFIFP